ncbi:MAG: hypothetical protein RL747_1609, partial [Bacteroidota bacterium]
RDGHRPENRTEKNRKETPHVAKIGLCAVSSPVGECFVEVVEGEEVQNDGELQAQNIPRPFADDEGVFGFRTLA